MNKASNRILSVRDESISQLYRLARTNYVHEAFEGTIRHTNERIKEALTNIVGSIFRRRERGWEAKLRESS